MKTFLFVLLSTVAVVLLWAIWTEAFVDGLIFTLGLVTTSLCGYLVADYFFTAEKNKLLADLDMHRREIAAQKEETDILRKQFSLTVPQAEVDELRKRLKSEEESKNKIHGEFLAQAANISSLNTRLNSLQKEYNHLQEDADVNSESRITELEAIRDTLAMSKDKLNDLAHENKALKEELNRYKILAETAQSPNITPIEEKTTANTAIENDDAPVIFLNDNGERLELESHRSRPRSTHDDIKTRLKEDALKEVTIENQDIQITASEHGISESNDPEPAPSSNSQSIETIPEDLKVVEGIGPKIELLLKESGIKGLKELSVVPIENLKEILAKGGSRYKLNDPTSWPEQARLLVSGQFDRFKTFTSDLLNKKDGK